MSPILGAVGLILALSGLLSLVGLSDLPLYFVELTQLHTLPLVNVVPPEWLYLLLGILLLLFAGSSGASSRTWGEDY